MISSRLAAWFGPPVAVKVVPQVTCGFRLKPAGYSEAKPASVPI
jgi:hypothetical protein